MYVRDVDAYPSNKWHEIQLGERRTLTLFTHFAVKHVFARLAVSSSAFYGVVIYAAEIEAAPRLFHSSIYRRLELTVYISYVRSLSFPPPPLALNSQLTVSDGRRGEEREREREALAARSLARFNSRQVAGSHPLKGRPALQLAASETDGQGS